MRRTLPTRGAVAGWREANNIAQRHRARPTPQAQSHSASLHNLRGAPTGAQARSERETMDAECRLQRS